MHTLPVLAIMVIFHAQCTQYQYLTSPDPSFCPILRRLGGIVGIAVSAEDKVVELFRFTPDVPVSASYRIIKKTIHNENYAKQHHSIEFVQVHSLIPHTHKSVQVKDTKDWCTADVNYPKSTYYSTAQKQDKIKKSYHDKQKKIAKTQQSDFRICNLKNLSLSRHYLSGVVKIQKSIASHLSL